MVEQLACVFMTCLLFLIFENPVSLQDAFISKFILFITEIGFLAACSFTLSSTDGLVE